MSLQYQARQQADGYGRSTGWNAVEASRRVRSLNDKELAETDIELSRSIEGRWFRFDNGVAEGPDGDGQAKVVPVATGFEACSSAGRRPRGLRPVPPAGRSVSFRTGKTTMVVIGEKAKRSSPPLR